MAEVQEAITTDAATEAAERGGPGIVTELVFNYVIDWLTPQEYDGRAMITLPPNDPRRRLIRVVPPQTSELTTSLAGLGPL